MRNLLILGLVLIAALPVFGLNLEQVLTSAYDSANGTIKVGFAASSASVESTQTNTPYDVFTLTHTTTGSPANGIGVGAAFTQETTAGNNEIGMLFEAIVTDVTAASEDFDAVIKLMAAGAAAAEKFRVTSTGIVTLVNGETIDNSANNVVAINSASTTFSGTVTVSGAGGIILSNAETITNGTNGRVDIGGDTYLNGAVKWKTCTIADGDATPDVAGCHILTTSANTNPTAISDLDNPVVGSTVCIVGGSATNSTTIADAGNFALSAGFTAGLDDVLCLYVQADNDYIETNRSDN